MLCRRRLLKYVTNVKVISGEECTFQHKFVVAVLRIPLIKKVKKQFEPRIKVGIQNIESALSFHRLRWFGHVVRSSGWLSKVREFKIVGVKRPGRPKMTWEELLKKDRTKLSLMEIDHMTALRGKDLFSKNPYPLLRKMGSK